MRSLPPIRIGKIGKAGLAPARFSVLTLAPALWLDASDLSTITESGGAVSQWNDKSGNGNHLTQGTGSAQPATGSATMNGLNVLDFDGGDELSRADALGFSGAPAFTVFVVAKADKGDRSTVFAMGNSSSVGGQIFQFSMGSDYSSYRYTNGYTRYNEDASAAAIGVARAQENESSLYYDFIHNGVPAGLESGTGSSTVPLALVDGVLFIGGEQGASYKHDGQIAEVLVYDRALSNAEINQIGSYLAAKWGIGWTDMLTGYDVFALAGQSNMVGRNGPIDGVLDATDARILQYGHDNNALRTAAAPLDHWDETANTVGPGLSFAKAYLAGVPSDRGVILIPAADGGTAFGTGYWQDGGAGHEWVITAANAVMAHEPAPGNTNFKGILWHQGESDASMTEAQYAAELEALVAAYRSEITGAGTTTPFIVGEVPDWSTQYGAGVAAALAAATYRIGSSAYVETSDLDDGGDSLHFDAASARTLGARYNTALAAAIANVPDAAAETGAAGHWLLGSDNTAMEDLVGGQPLTAISASPTHNTGYTAVGTGNYNGLASEIFQKAQNTICLVVRVAASQNAILGGTMKAGSHGAAIYQQGTDLNMNSRGTGFTATTIGTLPLNEWHFIALAQDDVDLLGFLGDSGGNSVATVTGTSANIYPDKQAVGNAYYSNSAYNAVFDVAEFIIFNSTLDQTEIEAVYARSVTRLAARGITVE